MTGELLLLAFTLGLPAVLITGIVVAVLSATRRRQASRPAGGPDLAVGRAWAAAWQAHVRIAQLEHRVRVLEHQGQGPTRRDGAA